MYKHSQDFFNHCLTKDIPDERPVISAEVNTGVKNYLRKHLSEKTNLVPVILRTRVHPSRSTLREETFAEETFIISKQLQGILEGINFSS